MELKFTIKGGKQLEEELLKLGPRVAQRGGDRALSSAARVFVREAKSLVPVRTGALRKSITYTRAGKGAADQRVVFIGFKPPISRRAHFTEYGTVNHAAKPFMRPALDGRSQDALNVMAEILALFLESRGGLGAEDIFGDEQAVDLAGSE